MSQISTILQEGEMPEEIKPGETPEVKPEDVKPEGAPEAKPNEQVWKDGKPFDPAAALALIEKLRKDEGAAEELARFKAEQAKADEERKRKQGEFEVLADDFKAKFEAAETEAKTLKEQLKQFNELSLAELKAQVTDWPEDARALMEISDDANALELKAQMLKLKPMVDKLMNASPKPGNGAGPTPQGGVGGNTDAPRPSKYRI